MNPIEFSEEPRDIKDPVVFPKHTIIALLRGLRLAKTDSEAIHVLYVTIAIALGISFVSLILSVPVRRDAPTEHAMYLTQHHFEHE